MSKIRETYVCTECGAKSSLWRGQCLSCKAWNTLELVAAPAEGSRKRPVGSLGPVKAIPLAHVEEHGHEPFGTGLDALDRVLGRGLVPGSALLMGGEPGNRQIHAAPPDGGRGGRVGQGCALRERRGIVAAESGGIAPTVWACCTTIFWPSPHLGSRTCSPCWKGTPRRICSLSTPYRRSPRKARTVCPATSDQVRAVATEIVDACKRGVTTAVLVGHVTKRRGARRAASA